MRSCSVVKRLQIVAGDIDDYKRLAGFHYRDSRVGPYAGLFAIRPIGRTAVCWGVKTVGVIVYTMPSTAVELRNAALGNCLAGLDRATQLALVNKNIRCISRVIIEPRFRGLGLAVQLVKETMPKMNVPIVEAMAVMGLVNPFFEKAGMTAYRAKSPRRCVQLIEALSFVGIEESELIEPQSVQRKLEQLPSEKTEFIEQQIKVFLASYGKRRNMAAGLERTRYVLSKLTDRPVYYIWFNPSILDENRESSTKLNYGTFNSIDSVG